MGIDVRLQTKVQKIESLEANKAHDGRLMVHFSNTAYGEKQTMKADMIVHGAGRIPEIDDLNLGAGSSNLSMRRTGIPNRFNSIAAVMPVGPAPTIKTGLVVVMCCCRKRCRFIKD